MEHVDPLTGATDAWEAFVQSLDPARLERERYGQPGPSERPGSAGWKRMVVEHDAKRAEFYRVAPPTIPDDEFAQMLREASAWDRRNETALTERHLQIALAVTNPNRSNAA